MHAHHHGSPLALICLAAGGLAAACSTPPDPPPPRPNVLLISLDTVRADRVGGSAGLTPTLDELAAGGVRFANAYASTPLTLPSHTVLLTGTEPLYNGVRNNGSYRVADELSTTAEHLQRAGYHTVAVLGSVVLDARYGLDQGFAVYDEVGADPDASERRADEVVERALAAIDGAPEPWFLWVHLFDPHWPYQAPEPWSDQHEHPYDAEIAYTDAQLAPLLERASDALVVVTADHGESLGEHGERTHGMFVHDATTRVPLIVRWPGQLPAGLDAAGVARLLDVTPTLLDLLDLPAEPAAQGRSLRAHWEDDAQPDQPVYAESYMPAENLGLAPVHALLRDELRLVRTTRSRLYDRAEDPGERREVSGERESDTATMLAALEAYEHAHAGPWAQRGPDAMDAETRQRLEALGYVQAPLAAGQAADPYDQLDFLDVVGNLDQDPELRVEALWGLLQERPEATHVWSFLIKAAFEIESPRFPQFVEQAAIAQPDSFELQARWVWLLAGQDDPRAADALAGCMALRTAQEAEGRVAELSAVRDLARAALAVDDSAAALTLLDSLADGPMDADLRFNRALLRQLAERWEPAAADYETFLAEHDDDLDAWINLASCRVRQDRLEQAVGALDRALLIAPDHAELQHRRATLDKALGARSGQQGQ